MPSRDSIAGSRGFGDVRRRALLFAGLCLVGCVLLAAIFDDQGATARVLSVRDLLGRARHGAPVDWAQAPAFFAVGLGAGVLAGMLGMGGGVLKVAGLLVIFKLDIFFARAVSLVAMFVAAVSATRVFVREGGILWHVIRPMILPALGGVLAGVFLGNMVRGATLTHFFAFFALFLGFTMLGQVFADPNEHVFEEPFSEPLEGRRYLCSASIGVLHGFLCGLLGIAGGVAASPMQQVLLRVPARNAIANAVVVSAVCTGLGSIAAISTGVARGDFELVEILFAAVWIGAGAAVGAHMGARWVGKVSVVVLKLLFVVVGFTAGLAILLR